MVFSAVAVYTVLQRQNNAAIINIPEVLKMIKVEKYLSTITCIAVLCSFAGCSAAESQRKDSFVSAENTSPEGETIEVTGTPLAAEQLIDYSPDYKWAEDYVDTYDAGAFLDTLECNELKTAYCKAVALVRLLSTENIEPSSAIDLKNRAYLLVESSENGKHMYMESGYTYDSFMSAYEEVFSESLLSTMLNRLNVFYSYNGELWYAGISMGGNAGEIHREYELISRTDTEVKFRRTTFSVDIGEPITEYDSAKRDEYIQDSVDYSFVLTNDGWKAEEFLNQQNSEGTIYFF